MTIIRHTNNISTTLAGNITNVATTCTVASATGFPTLSGGDGFYLTFDDSTNIEIVLVTGYTGTTIDTMTRGQQGTSGTAFSTGALAEIRPTADAFDRKADGAASAVDGGIALFDGTTGKVLKSSAAADGLINTMTVGLGNAGISTSMAFGYQALSTNSGGSGFNTAIGYQSLKALTTAQQNTATGHGSGLALTTGAQNCFYGHNSGLLLTTGGQNVVIGALAMNYSGTGSSNNIAIGYGAGQNNGSSNVFIGASCGSSTAMGIGNTTAVGAGAINGNGSTGTSHSLFGYAAFANGGAANNICAFGYNTVTAGSSCDDTSAFGYSSFSSLTSGKNNTGMGTGVGVAGATGAVALTTGAGNTLIGSRAGTSAADCANAIALGRDAVATKATGATSSDFGPGLSIGSAAFPVGFRGDGTIIPSSIGGAGFIKEKINGTFYYLPLYADAESGINTVPNGGTSRTSATAYAVICGGTSSTSAQQSIASVGTSGQVLTSNGAGALPTFQSKGTTISAFKAYRNTTQSITAATHTKIELNTEAYDYNSTFDNATNFRHTPTTGGKFLYFGTILFVSPTDGAKLIPELYKNGTIISQTSISAAGTESAAINYIAVIEMNGTDYVELFCYRDNTGNIGSASGGSISEFSCHLACIYLGA